MRKLLQTYALDVLLVLCLVAGGLRLSSGLEFVVDLTLFDETGYLYAGTHLPSEGLMPPAWAPLYGVWYFALHQFEPDPVALYYLNFRLLSVAAPALVLTALRAYGVGRLVALFCGWGFLLAVANLPVWPKPGSFALCLALLFVVAARDPRTPTRAALLLALGALLCSYVRPEYALAYVLLLGLALVLIWRRRERLARRAELIQLIIVLVASFGLAATFGVAALDHNNDRGFEAFAQHYAINWAAWTGRSIDPWTEFDIALADSFGPGVQSLGAAIRVNPGALARHVATNLSNYPGSLAYAFLTPLLPSSAPGVVNTGRWALGLLALAAVAWGLLRRRHLLRERLRERGLQLLGLGLLCAPAVASAIVVYPRIHYLLLQGVLIMLGLGILTAAPAEQSAAAPREQRRWALTLAAAGLLTVALTPPVGATWYAAAIETQGSPNRDTVLFVRQLGRTTPTNLLEAEGGFHVYLGDQYRRVPHFFKEGGASAFLRERDVDMIIVSDKLLRDRRYAADPEWLALLADPGAAGFASLAIPGTNRLVLVKR